MPTYRAPGVFIKEIPTIPPSVAEVETAIPAFIGFTEKIQNDEGESLLHSPRVINSLGEYESTFGKCPATRIEVEVTETLGKVSTSSSRLGVSFKEPAPFIPDYMLYYSIKMFFANGGKRCYVVSIGDTASTDYHANLFIDAIMQLEAFDEPTLLVFPDACSHRQSNIASDQDVANIVNAALVSCKKMGDRFTIADVRNAVVNGTDNNSKVNTNFRTHISSDQDLRMHGAVYFPYLKTSLVHEYLDSSITITRHKLRGTNKLYRKSSLPKVIAANTSLSHESMKNEYKRIYKAVKTFVSKNAFVTLVPSGAVAGVYAKVDESRGVHKSPANIELKNVLLPQVAISNYTNSRLNVDASSGKSINAIRQFTGRGTVIWGARTLAGNHSEFRYVSLRRFFIFVEESVNKALTNFVFRANDANTWQLVKTVIENFLITLWRDGALAGAKTEEAFYVRVGLNQTMTHNDIENGNMIVEIGMATVRPAEFISLKMTVRMR